MKNDVFFNLKLINEKRMLGNVFLYGIGKVFFKI